MEKSRDANVDKGHGDTVGGGEGETNWESRIDLYPPPCLKQRAGGKLPYSTGNAVQCSAMT